MDDPVDGDGPKDQRVQMMIQRIEIQKMGSGEWSRRCYGPCDGGCFRGRLREWIMEDHLGIGMIQRMEDGPLERG